MELRSRTLGAASSSKGKEKVKYDDSSDGDSPVPTSSDPDYDSDGLDDTVEEFLNSSLENSFRISDDDLLDNVPKRRKGNSQSRSKQGRKSQDDQEEGDHEKDVDMDAEIAAGLAGLVEPAVPAEKPVRKKRGKKKKIKPVLQWEIMEQEDDKWIAENLNLDTDLTKQDEMSSETVDPSDDLIIPLLRYQKEWLAWALKQEASTVRGGILADEMGMGKTLQAISLVLLKRSMSIGNHWHGSSSSSVVKGHGPGSSASVVEGLPPIKGTLVICPLVAVMQWVSEIEKFTSEGSTKVLVYHGANRSKNHYQFSEYDFVITTYSIVEAEYRKYVMPPKAKCQYCGKLFYDKKLKIHLRYHCGPGAVKTSKQSKQQRKEPMPKKVPAIKISTSKTESGKRKKPDSGDKEIEIDRSGEDSAMAGQQLFEGKSILHSVTWERIILDEAHYIKERRSNTAKAVLALQSSYKWALSGTPIQNRVGELYSLIRFLQMVPYSYYFCKDCDCRQLDYSPSGDCPGCVHKSVRHFCWWNKYIASPIQDHGAYGFGKGAMLLLKHKLLKSVVLRRTKRGRAADLALPPRIVTLRRDTLDVVEEDYYTALYNESQTQFNTYVEAGTVSNNYAHIFDLLTRLRQAVDHPYLVEYSVSAMERKGKTVETDNDQICSLCQDPGEDTVVTACGHVFCKSCLIDITTAMGQNSCPSCSKPLTVDFTSKDGKEPSSKSAIKGFRPSSILNRIHLDNFQTSTKIDALREEIRFMVERDGSAKGIVFSQFSSFLDLIHFSLIKSEVNCVQLDGSMTMAARDAAIKKFTEDPNCRIFLMSLKAGGVALNLTVASNVFLMDPWWNPAVERQAQDRIHRIGQYKPIRVVRFIIEDTIEERILKLQEKKELVFEGTVGGSSEAISKLTEADMRFLFVT
ncbi:DNA repair protein RAD16 isoform X2 [Andrographis paniculata]|uniref:DNA repair protein RAD16 isoform X2 n=1 Tax=Andrographis paniculata TaxID=175694 RepID=UPI0021E7038D|nr:DNA repair protein RAD16 isoform X2 [Andrographis paniculata]